MSRGGNGGRYLPHTTGGERAPVHSLAETILRHASGRGGCDGAHRNIKYSWFNTDIWWHVLIIQDTYSNRVVRAWRSTWPRLQLVDREQVLVEVADNRGAREPLWQDRGIINLSAPGRRTRRATLSVSVGNGYLVASYKNRDFEKGKCIGCISFKIRSLFYFRSWRVPLTLISIFL